MFQIRRTSLWIGMALAISMTVANQDAVAQFGGGFGGGQGGGFGGQGGGFGGQGGGQQGGAGVIVSPEGVLRVRQIDPRLTRKRLDAAKAALNQKVARPSKLRKISLNRLEAVIAERLANGEKVTEDMKFMAGMTRIQHVFFYPETGDIVIAGPAEGYMVDPSGRPIGFVSGSSVMELQDLIVALRAFPPSGERANVISVSIDPTKEGLQRMQQFLTGIGGRALPRDTARITNGLQKSLGLQTVTIGGISPKTHFAQILVEADYRMKLIGIGLEKPPVKIVSYASRANPRDVARNALQRWYFTPNYECVRVSDDEMAMELVGDGVKLIGADELVRADGGRVATQRVDRAGKAFVQSFTAQYPQLAQRSPVYGQLRNLIDMTIAAAFIQQQDYYGQAGWDMKVLADESVLPVNTYITPNQVETAVNAIWKGTTLMTPIGGGVNIQPMMALATDRLLTDEDGNLKKARQQVQVPELAKGQWWWD